MHRTGTKAGPVALVALIALAGCGVGAGLNGGSDTGPTGAASPRASQAAGGDVLAPDVFQVREDGLWDGRPSLGGVWVAHPDVDQPDRVRIVNAESGQEVAGALFRRERDLPGPALQVSSDAAQALGMLAGDPTPLEVTALRRQDAVAAEAAPTETAPDPDSPEAIAEAAAAALAPDPAPEPAPEAAPAAPPGPVPVDPAEIEAVAQATAAILAAADLPEEAPEPPPAPEPAPEATEAPLADPGVAAAAAAIVAGASAPPTTLGAIATTTLAAPDAAPAQAPATAAIATYVQVGRFEVQANADNAARALAQQGLPAGVVEVDGENAWLVWLGPVADDAQGAALLEAAVAAGFPDATLVQG